MWIARDENDELWLYEEKPYKKVNQWKSSDGAYQSLIDSDWFPEISWEDDEPRELILKPIKEE